MQHAREYAKKGIHLLLHPRSTPLGANDNGSPEGARQRWFPGPSASPRIMPDTLTNSI